METAAYIVLGFLLVRICVALVNLLTTYRQTSVNIISNPLVSVLIPARNEKKNIGKLLESLIKSNYGNTEVIVYDDNSSDNTADIVNHFSSSDQRIRLITGTSLPEGWQGKNYACHNLSVAAKGDYYLFLDADINIEQNFVVHLVSVLQMHKLVLLSVFPKQKMVTPGEKITVPVMNWMLLSLLPLFLIKSSRRPSLAAANGQVMLFESASYDKYSWHKKFKDNLVEDITIIREIKKAGLPAYTLVSDGQVSCRMYSSYDEGVRGFSKNVINCLGGSMVFALFFTMLTCFGWIPVAFSYNLFIICLYILMIILLKIFISINSRQSVLYNLLYHIPQMMAFLHILIMGIKIKITGAYRWKGRYIKTE